MKSGIVLLVMVFCVLPMACETTGEDKMAGETDISGTYNLVSIDGNPIPYAPMHGGQRVPEVVEGSLTMREGGAFASAMEYVDASGKSLSRSFAGTYTPDGTEFILKWQGAGTTKVVIEDNILTMNNEGMLFVYEK